MRLFQSKEKALFWLCMVLFAIYVTCDKDNPSKPDDTNNIEKLSFFEEELIGLWARYHAYDGSTQYVRFNADRTACAWEESSSSSNRIKKKSYSDWEIDEDNPISKNRFKVIVQGAGIYYAFDYPSDTIWPENFTNLEFYHSSEGKLCE